MSAIAKITASTIIDTPSRFVNSWRSDASADDMKEILHRLKRLRNARYSAFRLFCIDGDQGICWHLRSAVDLVIAVKFVTYCSYSWDHPLKEGSCGFSSRPIQHYFANRGNNTLWIGDQLQARLHLIEHCIKILQQVIAETGA